MTAIVPETCPIVSATGVVNADPVRGTTWQDLGAASNHLLGRGGVLIPATYIGEYIPKGTVADYRFRIWPRYQATHRVWTMCLTADTGETSDVTFTDPSGTNAGWRIYGNGIPRTVRHVETIASRTASETATEVSLSVTSAADLLPLSISCHEVARPELALDANDMGVELADLYGGMPMYATTGRSVGGAIDGIEAAVATAKRNGLLYVLRDAATAFSFTTTSYTAILAGSLEGLDRKKYRSETVRACEARAYGATGATTTMDVRISATNGDSLVLSWSAGDTGSWKTGTFDISVEDLTHARGLQGSAVDLITIEGKRTTGSNSAALHSVCIGGT